MSSQRPKPGQPGAPLDGERLVELALDATAEPSEVEAELLVEDAALRAELSDIRSFVASQRTLLESRIDASSRASGSSLSDRILGATTRRRLSWTGDLRLVRDLVLLRCKQSVWVRLAAASLILHLAALPVVAWFVWIAPPEKAKIFFALPLEDDPRPAGIDGADEPEIEVDAPDVAALLAGDSLGMVREDEAWNARRLSRFVLQRDGAPLVAGATIDGELESLLAARSAGILEGDWSGLPKPAALEGKPIHQALFAEALMDRAVLQRKLNGLREALEALEPMSELGGPASRDLVRAAATRSMQLGFDDESLRFGWRADAWAVSELAESKARSGQPLSEHWFTQLEHAVGEEAHGPIMAGLVGLGPSLEYL